jgi:hypothetical protein
MVSILQIILESEHRPPQTHLVKTLAKEHGNTQIMDHIVPWHQNNHFTAVESYSNVTTSIREVF